MPDLNYYSEPLSRLDNPVPVAVAQGSARRFHVTVSGEVAAPGLAIIPKEFAGPAGTGIRSVWWRPGRPDVSLQRTRTRGWSIIHIPSGLTVFGSSRFLPWTRDCAHQLAALPAVNWSGTPDQLTTGASRDQISNLLYKFLDRIQQFGARCWSRDAAARRRAYRTIRRLGAEYHPHPPSKRAALAVGEQKGAA